MTEPLSITEPGVVRRFLARVDTSAGADGCHIWQGSTTPTGYGHFRIGGRPVYAHRFALGHARGIPLREDEFALHRCDNPPCVNPAHLYVGDQLQNMRDCVERGRANLTGLALGRRPGKMLGQYRTGSELCGTVRGYSRHLRHGEPTCEPCRKAINAYHRDRQLVRS